MKERKVFGISEATTTISDIERRGREAKNKSHSVYVHERIAIIPRLGEKWFADKDIR